MRFRVINLEFQVPYAIYASFTLGNKKSSKDIYWEEMASG